MGTRGRQKKEKKEKRANGLRGRGAGRENRRTPTISAVFNFPSVDIAVDPSEGNNI